MQPEVLRPQLRPIYSMVADVCGSVVFAAVCLMLSAAMAGGIRALSEPELSPQAPVLALPASVEEPSLYSGYFGYNDGPGLFRSMSVFNGTLHQSLAFRANGNVEIGDASSDVHTIHGKLVIQRENNDMDCTLTFDPLDEDGAIVQECHYQDDQTRRQVIR